MSGESWQLLASYREGDSQAAQQIFQRYVSRLTALARAHLAQKLNARLDPEDIVQSAYRSFFVRARDGEFALEQSGDLWRLLAAITMKKLYRQAAHHGTAKRSADRELATAAVDFSREPDAAEAVAAAEELAAVLVELPPWKRRILELSLQDEPSEAIAQTVRRSERTIRRVLAELQARLEARLLGKRAPALPADRPRRPTKPEAHKAEFDPRAPVDYRNFVIERFLGSGGLGKVYRGLERSLARPVALKVLKKIWQTRPEYVDRFVDEARTVAGLRHPNLVGVHGLGRTPGGGYFLVMDLVDGPDLERAAANQRVPIDRAVAWTVDAARAVHYANQQGVIHCDLKPSNLLLASSGAVLVTDFGLARRLQPDKPGRFELGGTAGFMAPEQWRGEPLDARTDVFGLGAVLYCLVSGQPPHNRPAILAIMRGELDEAAPPSLCSLRKDVPDELDQICQRALRFAPSQRYATAAELADALSAIAVLPSK